jgi:hypothetical protein
MSADAGKPKGATPLRKRPYETPRLTRYGDVTHLTKNRFAGGRKDAGKLLKTRTR